VTRPELIRSFTDAALSPDPELASAALMIARVEYAEVDAARYLAELDFIGVEARRRLSLVAQSADTPPGVDAGIHAKVLALNELLFDEIGFAGNETDYEDPRNSFLNEVLDRRTGIPITLSLVYIEVARRAGLAVEGINYPGHFLVRCRPPRTLPHTEDLIIDPFHGGTLLSRERLARQPGGTRLPRATKPQILTRMLGNLKRVYVRMQSITQAREIADLLIAVDPSAIDELRDRGLMAYQMNDFTAALRDLQAYLQLIPSGEQDDEARQDRERIWEHVKTLHKRVASLN
jgi:regulator of sirC expression with transglutaminase-like and TPR domain